MLTVYLQGRERRKDQLLVDTWNGSKWAHPDDIKTGGADRGGIGLELRQDILSHFFDSLNCGWSVGKPKNNGLLRKKNTKRLILKQKGTRMAEDGEDWNGLEMAILKSLAKFFKIHERWSSYFKIRSSWLKYNLFVRKKRGQVLWDSRPDTHLKFKNYIQS